MSLSSCSLSHTPRASATRYWHLFWMLALLACLSGCAANNAFREGQQLADKGDLVGAHAAYTRASSLKPNNVQYKVASLRAREHLLNSLIIRAKTASASGQLDEAEKLLREALALDGTNERALSELLALKVRRGHDTAAQQARVAKAQGDEATAEQVLRRILIENPNHAAAQALMAEITSAQAIADPKIIPRSTLSKSITLEFKDSPIKTVFEVISRTSGINFVFDNDVKTDQKTSIFLKDSTIDSAVSLVLLTNQLEKRILDDNTVLIYPNSQAKNKDYQPLSVRAFYLSNAEVKSIETTVKTIAKPREIVADEKLNMLIVRDTPDALDIIEKIIALQDIPEPEVMLEVEILEVKRSKLVDLGVRWPEQLSLSPLPTAGGDTLTLKDLRNLSSSTTAATIGPTNINAKDQNSDANILANPRIRARNREKAKILIGERVPNVTTTSSSTGFVSESVTYVDVGLKLEVEPTIYLENEVAIKLSLEVSNIINQIQTKSGSLAYQIGTRTATSVLRLRDGENQVIAGLISDEDRRTANKIPLLGQIPLLGRLFGSQTDDKSKTEIVLSITPRVVRNVQRQQASVAQFSAGTESSLTNRVSTGGTSVKSDTGTKPAAASSTTAKPGAATTDVPAAGNARETPLSGNGGDPVSSEAPSGTAQLRWQGPTQLSVGDTFALQLVVQSDLPVIGLPMAVSFDPDVLQVISVLEGDFLKQGGAQAGFSERVDTAGRIVMTANRAGDTGATEAGSAFTLNLKAIAASDQSRVQLLTTVPIGVGGRNVAAQLPPPHTLVITP